MATGCITVAGYHAADSTHMIPIHPFCYDLDNFHLFHLPHLLAYIVLTKDCFVTVPDCSIEGVITI